MTSNHSFDETPFDLSSFESRRQFFADQEFQKEASISLLENSILTLDSATSRRKLNQMTLDEAITVLNRVEAIQNELASGVQRDIAGVDPSDERLLSVAAHRLCSDLTESVMLQAVDAVQDTQHSIDFLNQQLRQKLRQQYQANQILSRARSLREKTAQQAEACGMGLIL